MFEEKKNKTVFKNYLMFWSLKHAHTCTQMRMPTPLKDIDLIADVVFKLQEGIEDF